MRSQRSRYSPFCWGRRSARRAINSPFLAHRRGNPTSRDDSPIAVGTIAKAPLSDMRSTGLLSLTHGQGGIRTHGTLSRTHTFQACALNHSATDPTRGQPFDRLSCAKRAGRRNPPTQRAFSLLRTPASGQGEIRTHDTLAGTPVFETGAFNHSATCPEQPVNLPGNPGSVNELRVKGGSSALCERRLPSRFPSLRLIPPGTRSPPLSHKVLKD